MLDISANAVLRCIEKENLNTRIVCITQDSANVMLYIKKNPGSYLYFLDIDLGRAALNGVDIARLIKKQEPLSKIVFVTSHADMGMDILKGGVEALALLKKPPTKIKSFRLTINISAFIQAMPKATVISMSLP